MKLLNIKEFKGNLFDSKADVLCHQVNAFGIMGAGIAKEVKKRFPGVYQSYKEICEAHSEDEKSLYGKALILPADKRNRQYIANLFGQDKWMTDYAYLESSLRHLLDWMERNDDIKSVAFPYKMSCGLAGGNWDTVRAMIEGVFCDTGIQVEIWRLYG